MARDFVTCKRCGSSNGPTATFCGNCGFALREAGLSETTISFHPGPEDRMEGDLTVRLGALEGPAVLVVKSGADAGTRFVLDKESVTCGRHPESDIFLNDVSVSRKHAAIMRTESGFRLADAGSLNGTYVNRKRVEAVDLHNGDLIQIGKFKLLFFDLEHRGAHPSQPQSSP
jgi:hypothetical protein